ncbi:TPA: magnesium transporter [Legionella pneumophila]|nr:magnesium transporter [Legionella pneumophila]HAT7769141.1 magnesium transporter [Legionella pneumophila]HAT8124027.1 magnesium transporter [Legionella pneumophila]HAT8357935.1 magnesium transporter [Legionella pneumophila]HAT8721311.1 magnesium transporter [Legionella pneumophila]
MSISFKSPILKLYEEINRIGMRIEMHSFDSIAVEFDLKNHSMQKIAIEDLNIDYQDKDKIYWIHSNLNQKNIFKKLREKLRLPEQVIQLCGEKDNRSTTIEIDEALTLQIQGLCSMKLNDSYDADFGNLIIHLTPNYCFTASKTLSSVLFDLLKSCPKSLPYAKTSCFLLFLLLEGVINDYAKIHLAYEELADQLDAQVRTTNKNTYSQVLELKHGVMKIKRYTIAIREILMRLTSRNILVISEQCRTSLYNLSNHCHLIVNEVDSLRDMLNGLLGQIDNQLMQNMNETMKVLTAFAAIFLPLSLITGIYGMNFYWMPELGWKYGYFWALGLIVLCAFVLFLIFRKKKWF